jgi:predicted phage-related endonuclease
MKQENEELLKRLSQHSSKEEIERYRTIIEREEKVDAEIENAIEEDIKDFENFMGADIDACQKMFDNMIRKIKQVKKVTSSKKGEKHGNFIKVVELMKGVESDINNFKNSSKWFDIDWDCELVQ